ncbi:prepilin-type N-terminal cleavage/methylation domain-containing protein (plasmid) [Xanthomonas campestris pv. campestris]|uniref:type II secretion system protein n=1 Tax=Xanthomonas TaxID=338 RepID=UPI0015E3EE69|nr:type II secretion system protein [Xanthomonas arboricola]WDJ74910.1 prepilin-type N-terminal cleavage/methylation domain-containing protein [Xanthomonas campestris pv. campestris]
MKNSVIRGRRNHGFSLVELMIVIAIIAAFLVFVGPRIMRAFSNNTVTKESTNVRDLMTASAAYRDSGGLGASGSNVVPLLVTNGDIPSSWRMSGGTPFSGWNDSVTVVASGLGIAVSYAGVPQKDCVRFATKTSAEDLQTTVNGGSAMTGTMPATTAAAACANSMNSVAFTQIR